MSSRLNGKTVLITGASSGIGRSTALEFARSSPSSLRLILTARQIDVLKELAAEIAKEVGNGVRVYCHQLDITQPAEIDAFVSSLPAEFSAIDVLVNNAGLVKGVAQSPAISRADIDEMMLTNVHGVINMTQAILPKFLSRSPPTGDIVNIGSIAGREPYVGGSIYCATKAAVSSYTSALRRELIGSRVRVLEVAPGQVETNFSVVRFGGDRAKADAVYAGCEPLTPEDVADYVVFAVSRRENVVLADLLMLPNHQGSATILHRAST